MSRVGLVLLCSGSGTRFGADKLAVTLGGKPVWRWALDAAIAHPGIAEVVVVTQGERLAEASSIAGVDAAVEGGATRQASALRGLRALSPGVTHVLFHDGARPFLTQALLDACLHALETSGGFMVGRRATDTVKQAVDGSWSTLDRSSLVTVQTPQGGAVADFFRAHQQAERDGWEATDDAALLERIGIPVQLVEWNRQNLKITTPDDLLQAQSQLAAAREVRTGLGYDIHSFSEDPERPLWLGGVEFDDRPGLDGHSDADALLHAVTDAVLGAAALGDIGQLFPNTDPRWKDARSVRFLEEAGRRLVAAGFRVTHVDATVIAERPKVMPRSSEIRAVIAGALGISSERVSIKATTNEKLGAIGRSEGIAAMAIATVESNPFGDNP